MKISYFKRHRFFQNQFFCGKYLNCNVEIMQIRESYSKYFDKESRMSRNQIKVRHRRAGGTRGAFSLPCLPQIFTELYTDCSIKKPCLTHCSLRFSNLPPICNVHIWPTSLLCNERIRPCAGLHNGLKKKLKEQRSISVIWQNQS